jgi:outer membrane protein assembly factor BamB
VVIERTTRCCIVLALVTLGAALFAQTRDMAPLSLRPLWSLPLGGTISAPPAFTLDHSYVPLDGRRVDAVNLIIGGREWTAEVGAITRPATGDGFVFVETSGAIVALRQFDGSVAWRQTLSDGLGAALVWDNGWLIAQSGAGVVTAYRGLDGHPIWTHETGAPPSAPASLAADRVYVSLSDGRVLALQVESGARLWSRTLSGPAGEILALDARLYVGSNGQDRYFYAVDAGSGQVEWRWRIGGAPVGKPVIDERRVYFAALDNVLRALDRSNGALRWHVALSLRPSAPAILAGDTVVVAGMGSALPAFSRNSGEPLDTGKVPGDITGGPHVIDHPWAPVVVVITRDIAKGDTLRALGRPVEPEIVAVSPLPNLITLQRSAPPRRGTPPSNQPPEETLRGRSGTAGGVTGSR